MMQVRIQLEELTVKVSESASAERSQPNIPSSFIQALLDEHQKSVAQNMSQQYLQVDERLGRVEALIRAQSAAVHASQASQIGPLYNPSTPPARRNTARGLSPASASRIRSNSTSVRVRLRQAHSTCQTGCSCSCHAESNAKTPSFMERMLGQVFIGYSGIPLLSNKCDSGECAQKQIPTANMEYWFPLGFCWSQIVRFHLAYDANTGPSLQLSTFRQVSDSSQCVSFALNGNIDGLKGLFQRGLASPRDISTTRGYSLLRVRAPTLFS